MKTKHIIFTITGALILCTVIVIAFAQNIGINTSGSSANSSALLDLNTGNTFTSPNGKGLLVPNVSLVSTTDAVTITSPALSLLVYNTNASMTGGSGVGFYYWDGAKWVPIVSTASTGICTDACTWTLVSVANSTLAAIGAVPSVPSYTVQPNKEVLLVVIASAAEVTATLADNPAVFQFHAATDAQPGKNLSLVSPVFNGSTASSPNITFGKIRGRKLNASATAVIITDIINPFMDHYARVTGTGVIDLWDGAGGNDPALYIFER